MDIGTKLKQLRKEKGITQKVIASYLGIRRNTYSQYESNARTPSIEILQKIASYYNVLGTFFFRDDSIDSNLEYVKILLDEYFRLIFLSNDILDELKSLELIDDNADVRSDFNDLLSRLMECYFEINEVKSKIDLESSFDQIEKLIEMHF